MRPTIEQIKEAIKKEGQRHGLIEGSVRIDIPPAIEIPGRPRSFDQTIDCKCGFKYELRTMHSGQTRGGGMEFHQVLATEMTEHGVNAAAIMIYELHEPKN